MTTETAPSPEGRIFFTKQPVFDDHRRIWGYELLGGALQSGILQVFPRDEGGEAGLASSTYFGLQEDMERGKKVVVGFDASSVCDGVPHALPPSHGMIRMPASQLGTEGVLDALVGLKSEGYGLLLDILSEEFPESVCDKSTIIAYDYDASFSSGPVFARVRAMGGSLLVRGIRTMEQFETARELGATFFQGPFFKEPELVPDRKLTSSEVSRLNMLRVIESHEPDVEALAEAVKVDVSVTFRLLSFLNSAAFDFRQKIESIDHAIRLLGWSKVRVWLRAVLLADMAGQEDCPRELAALSLQRARFLELLTTEYDYWGFNPGTMFLLGMFSLLDAILGMPMQEVVGMLPLEAKLKDTLCGDGTGTEHRPLFDLCHVLEEADWAGLDEICSRLGLDREVVESSWGEAMNWAGTFFTSGKKPQ